MSDPGNSPATRTALVAAALAALGIGGYLLFFRGGEAPPETAIAPGRSAPAVTEPTAQAKPDVDQPGTAGEPEVPVATAPDHIAEVPPEPQLPALEDSDAELRQGLLALLGDGLFARWTAQDHLAQRISAQISGLARGHFVAEDLLLDPLPGSFQVERRDGQLYAHPSNYGRYDAVVRFLEGIDTAAVAEFFHRYRPLFELAYAQLGQPPEQFDSAVLAAIDHLLETPEPTAPAELFAESVAYRYTDPALEGLSPARKQMLRLGPEHGRALKARLAALRIALAGNPSPPPADD